MKSLENFHLRNMELVHKYLNGDMAVAEKNAFEHRLQIDQELKDDFEIVEEYMAAQPKGMRRISIKQLRNLAEHNFDQIRLDRKAMVGRDLITYGIGAVALALLMLSVCIAIIGFID